MQKALVIDDENSIRRLLKTALAAHGIEVAEASTGREGIALAIAVRPDFILLDLGLPDREGGAILKELRQWYRRPIVILSVRNQEEVIVDALDAGADDYLAKPFNVNELLARIRVAERRYAGEMAPPLFQFGSLAVDLARRQIRKEGKEIHLTATEYEVLRVLVNNHGRVLTHRQILREIWGPNSSDHVQYLRVYIGHLRQKLEEDPHNPRWIVTEPGVGYRLLSP